jgi:hypothetical protein
MTHADYLKKRDEILSRLALDAHNSQWIGDETVAKAQAAIDALVNEVIGEDRHYEKYGTCPVCSGPQYACSCDTAEFRVRHEQRTIVNGGDE